MKPPFRSFAARLAGFSLAAGSPFLLQAEIHELDPGFHHLRNAEPREWSSFPEKSDADRLVCEFDLETPDAFQLLTLRQQETKQAWTLTLNGTNLGRLPRDHNHVEHGIAIPAGLLTATGNRIEIATESETPDDVRIGDLKLHTELWSPVEPDRAETLFQQRGYRRALPVMDFPLELAATEAETGRPIPCRYTIVDADTGALVLIGAESDDRLAVREGVVYSLDGSAAFRLAGDQENPRRYRIYCGRGFEYSLESIEVTVDGSRTDLQRYAFSLKREVPTPRLVACDTHLHTFQFDRHGDCNLAERLISIAGEGVELPVSSAHDKHIDYAEEMQRIGASPWFTPVLGCEVTTNLGHFNTFPVEPGATPAEHKLRPWPQIFQNIFATPGVEICILNHGRDVHRGFRPLDPANFNPETGKFTEGRELKANGIELINSGAQQTDPFELLQDWFALLRGGHRIAAVGSSDSHTVNFAIPGQGRTYLEVPDDSDPSRIDAAAAVDSFLDGRTWVSFGLLTRLDLNSAGTEVVIRVLGPSWVTADRVRLFRNGEEIQSLPIAATDAAGRGEKFTKSFSLAKLGASPGDFLCAVATGPGITEPWWPIMPPYQPDTPDFDPFIIGISPAVWIP